MSGNVINFNDTYHFYFKGVRSQPEVAYNESRKQICAKWGSFMNSMVDTSNVVFQDFEGKGNGGTTARLGVFDGPLTITGARSKTKSPTFVDPSRKWETWFDIAYQVKLIFVPTGDQTKVNRGRSIEEINEEIKKGTNNGVV